MDYTDLLIEFARAADRLGVAVVMLDVPDCGNLERTERRKALYECYGFRSLEAEPLRMFLPMATVRMLIEGELK